LDSAIVITSEQSYFPPNIFFCFCKTHLNDFWSISWYSPDSWHADIPECSLW